MEEKEYWLALEYRLGDEFRGMTEGNLSQYWCDGVYGELYLVTDHRPRIIGVAWICDGPHQAKWKFELLLPRRVKSREEIDWTALFPAQNVTRWLAVDKERKFIQIEPAVAVPDLK